MCYSLEVGCTVAVPVHNNSRIFCVSSLTFVPRCLADMPLSSTFVHIRNTLVRHSSTFVMHSSTFVYIRLHSSTLQPLSYTFIYASWHSSTFIYSSQLSSAFIRIHLHSSRPVLYVENFMTLGGLIGCQTSMSWLRSHLGAFGFGPPGRRMVITQNYEPAVSKDWSTLDSLDFTLGSSQGLAFGALYRFRSVDRCELFGKQSTPPLSE